MTIADYDVVIGWEVHLHLATASKMFCGCRNVYGDEPNTHVCPVCLGWPGTLPACNEYSLTQARRVADALGMVRARHW